MYRIVFYCPDKHIEYDGKTPDTVGVGGGVTSRVRMARALAKQGQDVTMIANCTKREMIDDVQYLPLDEIRSISADVLIMNSSGGDYDLAPALGMDINARLSILWASGIRPPKGIELLSYDFVYAKSNFLRDIVETEWHQSCEKIFVAYNVFEEDLFSNIDTNRFRRDHHRLIYASHPEKGLYSAVRVMRALRSRDSRYHLIVCGGPALWGEKDTIEFSEPGIKYLGLIGQKQLAQELMKSSYSLNLQAIREVFGMLITESMRAGCVVIASRVGAYPEIIQDGENGFLVAGDHQSEEVIQHAVDIIWDLSEDIKKLSLLRRNAQRVIWNSKLMARVWLDHWNWVLSRNGNGSFSGVLKAAQPCEVCGKNQLLFPDGFHCMSCGRYTSFTSISA
jgi:glycosyltransferase involved in cell wall biosynthesis